MFSIWRDLLMSVV